MYVCVNIPINRCIYTNLGSACVNLSAQMVFIFNCVQSVSKRNRNMQVGANSLALATYIESLKAYRNRCIENLLYMYVCVSLPNYLVVVKYLNGYRLGGKGFCLKISEAQDFAVTKQVACRKLCFHICKFHMHSLSLHESSNFHILHNLLFSYFTLQKKFDRFCVSLQTK